MHELISIDVTGSKLEPLGRLKYKQMPRRGEWVELETNGKAFVSEVVMVAHSSVGSGSDIYLRKVGVTAEAVRNLCKNQ